MERNQKMLRGVTKVVARLFVRMLCSLGGDIIIIVRVSV